MSTEAIDINVPPQEPPPRVGVLEPLVAIRDLFVHFDLGVKREIAPRKQRLRIILSLIGASIGSAAAIILAMRFGYYPAGMWARLLGKAFSCHRLTDRRSVALLIRVSADDAL